jgi:hypothetical protein
MELEKGEGRVFGARYYTIRPNFEWWMPSSQLDFTDTTWRDMSEWCADIYGPTPSDGVWTPSARWYENNAKFWFRERDDMIMFLLRWS